jgi:NAD(P)-dependent dehydrogenase (short-subunit alcohol dehydrogenase family)
MDTDIAVFDKVISINARGALLVTKYASQSMVRLGKGGSIVNVSSQASLVALNGHISYGSSKAALDNITRVSALELGRYNIRVNSVNPTVVMTEMSAFYWGRPEIAEPFMKAMPLGRWATVDEIAAPDRVSAERRRFDDHRRLAPDRRRIHLSLTSDHETCALGSLMSPMLGVLALLTVWPQVELFIPASSHRSSSIERARFRYQSSRRYHS